MNHITDPTHLDRVLTRLTVNASAIAQAWLAEDAAACAPSGGTDGPGTDGPSDPTATIASRDRKFHHRDRLGRIILELSQRLEHELDALRPRMPTDPCACCDDEMATHGTLCFACSRYRRKMDHPCDDEIHAGRPQLRMCDCPDWCCDVCPDRAADQRSLSERCRKRMQRTRQRPA